MIDAPWAGSRWADDLALALELADVADSLTLGRFGSMDLHVDTKPDLTPVSDADRDTEVRLRQQLAAARPGDAVLGEEYGVTGESDRHWVLDPIDGTKSYVRGVPVWATLIALTVNAPTRRSEDVVVGVVSAPALGRRWWAARGAGAWVDAGGGAQQIAVSGVSDLGDASVSFSEWNDPAWEVGTRRGAIDRLLRSAWRTRAYGDFWSHMMVAEGSVDVAVEPELSGWDMAALIPVVEEAGGTISALDGRSPMVGGNAVSSNGLLHARLLQHFGETAQT